MKTPIYSGRATPTKEHPRKIRIEVCRSDPMDADEVLVGNILFDPSSDPASVAKEFGTINRLSDKQIYHLEARLHQCMSDPVS